MPSFITPAKRRSGGTLDFDDDDDFQTPDTSSSITKRQRLTQRITTSTRKDHQPGSIVRVWLKNFVTYKDAEFFPGPSLNMVIGPNGNGKSTLVCAICLGLGWGSQHLGRAKDVGDFVKHGASEGIIEIELKKDGRKYKSNPVIRAIIKKDGNKMTFMLNGRLSNRKTCQEVAKSFAIQVDNLCQFLPQDRVVEFASLSPVELLKSTQRAIASEEMIQWHEQLIILGKNQKDVSQTTKAETENLKNLENRQRLQEADVTRLREREAIKNNIKMLEAVRPIVEFGNVKKELDEAKARHREAQDDLAVLTAREAPALRAVNSKQDYMNAIKLARDNLNRKSAIAEQNASSKRDEISNCDNKIKLHEQRTEERKKTLRDTKVDIKRLDGTIANLKTEFERGQPEFDLAAIQEQTREIARQRNTIRDESEQIRREQSEVNDQMSLKDNEVKNLERQIQNLDSQAGKQEQKLRKVNEDAWKAWNWIKENQTRFEKPILGPPIVECSVKNSDRKYADMLESLIQQGDMLTFTAQTPADQRELHRLLKDEYGWRKTSTRCAPDPNRMKPPMSSDEFGALGFEGWARDYIQGPEPIINMLCEAANLHRTGLCSQEQTKEQFIAAERSSASGWVTPASTYRVMRRAEYGPSATSTTVRDVRNAMYWIDQPIDPTIKTTMQQNIDSLKQEIAILREQFDEFNQKVGTLEGKYRELQDREKGLANEKEEGLKRQKRFSGLETRIDNEEAKRKGFQDTLDEIQRTFLERNDELDQIYHERAQATLVYADMVLAYQDSLTQAEEAEIMLIEAESDFKVLSESSQNVKDMLQARTREVAELARTKDEVKERGRALQRDVSKIRQEADEELMEFVQTFVADIPLVQHDQAIEDAKERLGLIHDGNAGAIRQFMEREKTIERLKTKLEQLNSALEEVTGKLNETRTRWEPKLDALIKRISSSFSYNMGQINCNGEVTVFKHEDFEQWAIEIFVRFREGEPLTRLDAHRQSGGERAVSTIFYLMSLQTLTRSPFRVVDEINQGMDPRNERLVHSRMVAIATGNDDWQASTTTETNGGDSDMDQIIRQVDVEQADLGTGSGSQYFLVTPKLLHDLRYEEGMTVMCINSGEHLASGEDADVKQVSFDKSLEAHRALRTRLAAVGA